MTDVLALTQATDCRLDFGAQAKGNRSFRAIGAFGSGWHCVTPNVLQNAIRPSNKNFQNAIQYAQCTLLEARFVMKTPAPGKPTNFRLSRETVDLLEEISKETGLSKTEIVQLAVASVAPNLPKFRAKAAKVLLKLAAHNLQAHNPEQERPL